MTPVFMLWRHCERFGIDPRLIDGMDPVHQRAATAYERIRQEQEKGG